MRSGGFCAFIFATAMLFVADAATAHASVVSNWDKSARSWNTAHMTTIKAAMQAAGHQVRPDAPITAASLRTAVLVIGEPVATPTLSELDILRDFLAAGGMILLFGDTGIDLNTYNTLLSGIGSTIQFTPTTIGTSSALAAGLFTDGPSSIVGASLAVTSGNGTSGGTLIDNNYVRYERIGAGYLVVFGDRIDHDDFITATNTTLLLNIVSFARDPFAPIPAVSSALLAVLSLLLGAFAVVRVARGHRAVSIRR